MDEKAKTCQAMRRQGSHAAPVYATWPDYRRARVPRLSIHTICGSRSSRELVRTRPKAKEAALSCENCSGL
jgi:hypothetical protein